MKHEAGILSRFYKKNPIDKIQEMSDEEIIQAIDAYLDRYISLKLKKDPTWNFPTIPTSSMNDVRNKRTGVSKKPKISGRRTYE